MQRVVCPTVQGPKMALSRLQPRRAALTCSRPLLAVRCAATGAAGVPPVPNPIIRLAAAAASMLHAAKQRVQHAVTEAARQTDQEAVNLQIKQSVKHMRILAAVAPFAAVSGNTSMFFVITKAVASFIKLYLLLLFLRVLLSWFPTFQWWDQQPWLALRQVTDPYLKLFNGLVPPLLGSIDLTPLFGFFILQFLAGALDVGDEEARYW